MSVDSLTLNSIRGRPVVLELKRPVVARIATFAEWPLILIDLHTQEGVIGHSYLEPYIRRSVRNLIPVLHDLGQMLKGCRLSPLEFYEADRKWSTEPPGRRNYGSGRKSAASPLRYKPPPNKRPPPRPVA